MRAVGDVGASSLSGKEKVIDDDWTSFMHQRKNVSEQVSEQVVDESDSEGLHVSAILKQHRKNYSLLFFL
jgi:hypothetical protein